MMTFPTIAPHDRGARTLYDRLNPWVRERKALGRCFMDAGFLLQVEPALSCAVRTWRSCSDRPANMGIDLDRWIHGAPDLAVESRLPVREAPGTSRSTVRQYLSHGSAVVLTIEPLEQRSHDPPALRNGSIASR
jgi:hypothetical protein